MERAQTSIQTDWSGAQSQGSLWHKLLECLGIGPTLKEPSFPHLDSGPTSKWEEAISTGSQVVPLCLCLSGEELWLPTVTPSGGCRGQGRPCLWQHGDTQQMMQRALSSLLLLDKDLLWYHSSMTKQQWWNTENAKIQNCHFCKFKKMFLNECAVSL